MEILMIILFLIGYACIALEHTLNVNKAATALLLCALLWTCYILNAPNVLPLEESFQRFVGYTSNPRIAPGMAGWETFVSSIPSLDNFHQKVIEFVTGHQIIEHVGDVASILFFLMGAMTIVELIDVHGGFSVITDRITTKNKKKLLWMLSIITFFMSAILDNLTTTIVMVMLLRKIISNFKERWVFASIIVLAANSGGAFSPIGDVTTIMLWVNGNVTTGGLLPNLILPSIVSVVIPVLIVSRYLSGELTTRELRETATNNHLNAAELITKKEQKIIFGMGVAALVFVPIFKAITHLPPFVGVLLGLGILWVYTEILYHNKKNIPEGSKARISVVIGRIDLTTILFFLGILMAVSALQCEGILRQLAVILDETFNGNVYAIDIIIGALSSIVDNVPLVAGSMGMYEIAETGTFACDGTFWMFLAYCAGVGGSMLIIGSAAGVVVMGLEKVNFVWYLKNISLIALIGYLAGAFVFIAQEEWIKPLFGF
ncbi:MAG: sodium:proton antiporter NhaD [Paludibacteraceae bacterium]|nr:sodium:proton antiporter NhaD [Paludibacteraceae bacterium]